jgi:hypothetical protein
MEKICHIRGNKNYWENLNIYPRFKRKKHLYECMCTIIKIWDETLNIPYLEFRKKIRDIVIENIKTSNYFDTIIENNQECKEYFYNSTEKNILFYQQDDDDLFIKNNRKLYYNGVNTFQYSCIDPLGSRRKPGFHIHKDIRNNNGKTRIQSNQCLFVTDETLHKDLMDLNIWEADHTEYDTLTGKHGYFFYRHPISLQIYHLHSISLWKSLSAMGTKEHVASVDFFTKYVHAYITEIENIINVPRYKQRLFAKYHFKFKLNKIINLYKQLIN